MYEIDKTIIDNKIYKPKIFLKMRGVFINTKKI